MSKFGGLRVKQLVRMVSDHINKSKVNLISSKYHKLSVENFDFIFKIREPGMQAVTCCRNTDGVPEFAVGYTNGRIKMMDMRSKVPKYDFPMGE